MLQFFITHILHHWLPEHRLCWLKCIRERAKKKTCQVVMINSLFVCKNYWWQKKTNFYLKEFDLQYFSFNDAWNLYKERTRSSRIMSHTEYGDVRWEIDAEIKNLSWILATFIKRWKNRKICIQTEFFKTNAE